MMRISPNIITGITFLGLLLFTRGFFLASAAEVNLGLVILESENEFYKVKSSNNVFDSDQDVEFWSCNRDGIVKPDWSFLNKETLKLSRALFQAGKQLNTNNASAWRYAAELSWLLGDRVSALSEVNRAIELNGSDVLAWSLLGDINMASNEPTQAINAYKNSGDLCQYERIRANQIQLIQQALNQDDIETEKMLIDDAIKNNYSHTLCLSTFAFYINDFFLGTKSFAFEQGYTLVDMLPHANTLQRCLSQRLPLLVELGVWTEEEVCDVSLLWRWWAQRDAGWRKIEENNDLTEFCDHLPDLPFKVQQENVEGMVHNLLDVPQNSQLVFGNNLVSNGTFTEELSGWSWHSWNYSPLFPENIYLGGIVQGENFVSDNALRIQGLKRGPNIDEDVSRPRTFVGYTTALGSLYNERDQGYIISLIYRTRNFRQRLPNITLFDQFGNQVVSFQLEPTEGEWTQFIVIFALREPVTEAKLGLIMPARGEALFDEVAFIPVTLPSEIDPDSQLPRQAFLH